MHGMNHLWCNEDEDEDEQRAGVSSVSFHTYLRTCPDYFAPVFFQRGSSSIPDHLVILLP
jgi:hypothetical protein